MAHHHQQQLLLPQKEKKPRSLSTPIRSNDAALFGFFSDFIVIDANEKDGATLEQNAVEAEMATTTTADITTALPTTALPKTTTPEITTTSTTTTTTPETTTTPTTTTTTTTTTPVPETTTTTTTSSEDDFESTTEATTTKAEVEKDENAIVVSEPASTASEATATMAMTTVLPVEEELAETSTATEAATAPTSTTATATTTTTTSNTDEEEQEAEQTEIHSTFHPCTTSTTADNGEKNEMMMRQLIQFDYDLVLDSTSTAVEESSNNFEGIDLILQGLEEQLLEHVGLALEDDGLCGSGDDSSGRGKRMLRGEKHDDDGVAILKTISSLPVDQVIVGANNGTATCSEENLIPASASSTTCYPIAGYMTAYYYNNAITEFTTDDMRMKIYDIIERTMMMESTNTNSNATTNNTNNADTSASMHFVGVRGKTVQEESKLGNPPSSNTNNNGIILTPSTKPQPSSSSSSSRGLLIGTIFAGLLAVMVLAFFAVWRSGHWKRTTETNDDDDDDYEGDLNSRHEGANDNNAERGIGEMNMMHHLPPTSMIVSMNNNDAGVPSYNESNDIYRQEEEQRRQRQQHQWLSRSLTAETDMTPVVSNARTISRTLTTDTDMTPVVSNARSSRKQRQRQHVAASHLAEQTILECHGDDDDEESEW